MGNNAVNRILNNTKVCRLQELVVFKRGRNITASEMVDGDIPVVSAGLDYSGYHNAWNVKGPSITISSSGANAGVVIFHNYNFWAADCLYAYQSKNMLFSYYFLKYLQPVMFNLQRGSAQPHVYSDNVNNLKVVLPSLDEQMNISKVLSNYDQLIENNNKRIKLLEETAQELYKEWFVRFRFPGYENEEFEEGKPKKWKELKLNEIGLNLTSGSRPNGGIDNSLFEGVPSFGAEVIGNLGQFDFSSTKFVTEKFYDSMKKGKSSKYDILLYKDGAYIGKTTIFRDGFPYKKYCVNEHVFIVDVDDKIYKNFLYFTLHRKEMFNLMQILNKNSAQPGLTKGDIERIKIIVPEKKHIIEFNEQIEKILHLIFVYAKENRNLNLQRDSLLPRLMSGKISLEGKEIT